MDQPTNGRATARRSSRSKATESATSVAAEPSAIPATALMPRAIPASAQVPAVPVAGPAVPELLVHVSGVFVTGNRSLITGERYLIHADDTRLITLGPVEIDPNAVVLSSGLRGLDATGLNGRLILSGVDDRDFDLALLFTGIAGGRLDDTAETLMRIIRLAAQRA